MSFTSDYTKSPEQILLDLINNDNGTSFGLDTLAFLSAPTVRANDDGQPSFNNRLSTIRVTAVDGSGYGQYVDMNYRRIHFRDVFPITADDPTVQFPIVDESYDLGSNTYLSDLIPQINAKHGLNLQPSDYWDKSLPTFSGPPPYDPAYVRLESQSTSKVYIGGVQIRINPNDYPLDQRLPTTELSGLEYDNTEWMIPPSYAPLHTFVSQTMTQSGYW
jgi:hypothetical protein